MLLQFWSVVSRVLLLLGETKPGLSLGALSRHDAGERNFSAVMLFTALDLSQIIRVTAGVVFASGPARLTSTTSSILMEDAVQMISFYH